MRQPPSPRSRQYGVVRRLRRWRRRAVLGALLPRTMSCVGAPPAGCAPRRIIAPNPASVRRKGRRAHGMQRRRKRRRRGQNRRGGKRRKGLGRKRVATHVSRGWLLWWESSWWDRRHERDLGRSRRKRAASRAWRGKRRRRRDARGFHRALQQQWWRREVGRPTKWRPGAGTRSARGDAGGGRLDGFDRPTAQRPTVAKRKGAKSRRRRRAVKEVAGQDRLAEGAMREEYLVFRSAGTRYMKTGSASPGVGRRHKTMRLASTSHEPPAAELPIATAHEGASG